jgi:RNA polymerase sigma-70 factor (family 1)
MKESNDDILHGIANHSQQSFRLLFDLFASRLIHFSQSILKNRETAIEIVDEVFVKFWRNCEQATRIQNINVYLYTAVKNSSLNYLSRKSKEQITDPLDFLNIELTTDQNPEQLMITAELCKKIEKAVDELPPRCKIIFKLVREDGLKYKEVAEILNVTTNTVDAQMVIAVKRISEQIGNQLNLRIHRTGHKVGFKK